MTRIAFLLSVLLSGVLCAQEKVEPVVVEVVELELELESASLFENVAARAVVRFVGEVEIEADQIQEASLPRDTAGISFLRQEVVDQSETKEGGVEMHITFLPRQTGLVMFPSLSWESGEFIFQTRPTQLRIGTLQRSDAMELTVTPAKQQVYVGEPVRVDITWNCTLPAASLRQLMFNSSFIHHDGVELDVPRSNIPEEVQMGMPVAGRRIIARREVSENEVQLGSASFSLFLRFTKAGEFSFPPTRLELFRQLRAGGRFAPYASYFNNTLFESADMSEPCEYLFTESEAIEMTVLPLPETDEDKVFSGWFEPSRIESSIKPAAGDVGQLMELSVRVYSDASSGFLELPELRRQVGLQHRFWVESEPRRVWHPDGAEFLARFRPLTTTIQAFPALAFQVFDPATGSYTLRQTAAIPLEVREKNGQTYFELESAPGEDTNLTDQPEGIWHNDQTSKGSDFMNSLINSMADGFWLWIVLTVGAVIALLPVVKERRRRATDAVYRTQVEAYETFSRMPAGEDSGIGKRDAFRAYLAALSQKPEQAYTIGDAQAWMQDYGVAVDDMNTVCGLFQEEDAAKFGRDHSESELKAPELNALAKRMFERAKKGAK